MLKSLRSQLEPEGFSIQRDLVQSRHGWQVQKQVILLHFLNWYVVGSSKKGGNFIKANKWNDGWINRKKAMQRIQIFRSRRSYSLKEFWISGSSRNNLWFFNYPNSDWYFPSNLLQIYIKSQIFTFYFSAICKISITYKNLCVTLANHEVKHLPKMHVLLVYIIRVIRIFNRRDEKEINLRFKLFVIHQWLLDEYLCGKFNKRRKLCLQGIQLIHKLI